MDNTNIFFAKKPYVKMPRLYGTKRLATFTAHILKVKRQFQMHPINHPSITEYITLRFFTYKVSIVIRQCVVIFGCLALGDLVVQLTGIKLPASVIGLLLLTLFLKCGWVKLKWVKGISDFLVSNLPLFFVPPGVAMMFYFDIIKAQFWPIVVSAIISTFLVLAITGWVHQFMRKIQ